MLSGAAPPSSITHRRPSFTAPAGAPGVPNDATRGSTMRAAVSGMSCIGRVAVARYAARSESLTANESGDAGGLNVAASTVMRLYGWPTRRTSHWNGYAMPPGAFRHPPYQNSTSISPNGTSPKSLGSAVRKRAIVRKPVDRWSSSVVAKRSTVARTRANGAPAIAVSESARRSPAARAARSSRSGAIANSSRRSSMYATLSGAHAPAGTSTGDATPPGPPSERRIATLSRTTSTISPGPPRPGARRVLRQASIV